MGDYFDRFLAFHPPRPQSDHDSEEFERIGRLVRRSDEDLLQTLADILGRDSIENRLSDLAEYNSITPGRVPVAYVPDDPQPHNILVGIPYTGNYIVRMRGLETVVPHELTHTVLGKFNDGITEPIASLFIKDRSHLPRVRFMDALETRAALELFADQRTVCSLHSMADLFRNRAKFRNIVAYYHRQLSPKPPAERSTDTHEFVRLLARSRYSRDFINHPSIDLPPLGDDQRRRVLEVMQACYREVEPLSLLNPNESAGSARGFALRLGRALMHFLLLRGLEEKEPIAPAEARESVRRLLVFYFQPFQAESFRQYGYEEWGDLQSALLEYVVSETEEFRCSNEPAWDTFKNQLVRDRRYDPMAWNERMAPGPEPEPVERLMGRPEPPEPVFHPVIEVARQCPDGESIIDLTEHLGRDRDYDRYCLLGEE